VRHHHRSQALADELPVRQQIGFDVAARPRVDHLRQVRVGRHRAVPRKMLAAGRHASVCHAGHEGPGQRRRGVRVGMKRPRSDDFAHSIVEIEHRREAEIDAERHQLGRHHEAARPRQRQAPLRVGVVGPPVGGGRRQRREAGPQALHPPALLVDRDQQARLAQGMDVDTQGLQLRGILEIALEQDDAADGRLQQQFAVGRREPRPGQADHQRPGGKRLGHESP
jgi:hypothetical protein